MQVRLESDIDFAGFRMAARGLLAAGVPPEEVRWATPSAGGDLLGGDEAPLQPQAAGRAAVPAFFLELCKSVMLHRDPGRLDLLYRLLWRLLHEPQLRHDPLDTDILLARRLEKQVGHDIHKMRAFVRFRTVDDGDAQGPLHVAWFEPAHRIVEANAPWFCRRFANMRWAILTPDASAHWDLRELRYEAGADRAAAPAADAGEALWLTYYRSIFNPARLKLDMMRKEMPRRYWHNLPEATLIGELAATAASRAGRMIEQPATQVERKIVRLAPQPSSRAAGDPATSDGPTAAAQLDALHAQTHTCRDCPHAHAATQAVNGEGPLQPALMFVGEQPGDIEDLAGKPFAGPAGQLLDRALRQAGIERSQCFMTNAVRHFQFELRGRRRIHKSPGQREIASCAHWLEREIALVQPRALVALGATAARALLGRAVAVTKERGQWHRRPDGIRVFVTLHPSALLRMPQQAQAEAFDALSGDLAKAARTFGHEALPGLRRGDTLAAHSGTIASKEGQPP